MANKKVDVTNMTKATVADYALSHFGVTVNRKKSRNDVIKEFKAAEKDFNYDLSLKEEEKKKAQAKKESDHEVLKDRVRDAESEENISYPVILGGKEKGREDRTMYKPNPGGICLGDPPNAKVVDGEKITNSNPKIGESKNA